ncbi:ATP-dependent DNA ligase [Paenarthrobacter sp. Z7-10]|uniref:ATP-dependent DNA ligase n=1 Tax=Paenarthrobacter sp. Z7-10 TaxID=2787635 RepID=UPI0022A9E6CD|nr:ATP-dependent DNA ligase [Paenarthrobacter sp. Z7-10]MCZ2403791.1 ATP-dependent DNA ligase [Paenarthrobacter sp. Z7-10]
MAGRNSNDSKQLVSVGGHRLTLTNLDKILYPQTGTTKGDVLAYLAVVAPMMIPFAQGRPATRKRWVHGVGTPENPGQVFFQKNLDKSAPSWVKRAEIVHKERTNVYPLVDDIATLTWLGQIASLEIHVPQWRFGRAGTVRNPDRLVLDLDPGEGAGLAECAEVARLAKAILADMGLTAVPVTSGSKGIHLYAALDGSQSSEDVNAFAHELARALEADHPDLVVSDMKKVLRQDKVLVDWSQNNWAKTTICPYSLRGRFRPMVAAPRSWEELDDPDLTHLDFEAVTARVQAGITPGEEVARPAADAGTNKEDGDDDGGDGTDRLHKYRSMRDAGKTPEPVPAARPARSEGRSFVIQEHHARRLHYDFRLERGGVLVSWAVPKGVPTEPKKNHLAVQTEDHPLEYGSFAGTIPKGEYGAGDVLIWDAGSYELEKWRDGNEVIVTLHGRDDGGLGAVRKVALIHTGGDDPKSEKNWLMHLMKDQPQFDAKADAGRDGTPDPAKAAPAAKAAKDRLPTDQVPAESSAGRSPAAPTPMLATLGSERDIDQEQDWDFEMKWDGMRAIAMVADGSLRLVSRNGNDVTAAYPELAVLAEAAAAGGTTRAVFDGEIVALNKSGRPDFRLLQSRMKLTKPAEVEAAQKSAPVALMVFDLLEHNGHSLLRRSFQDRRSTLEEVLTAHTNARIQLSPLFEGNVDEAVATSVELELEGVMAKKRGSTYTPGRRSAAWIKIKNQQTQEVVVAGWKDGQGRRSGSVGSLLLGVPVDGKLQYLGNVGSGFTDRDLEQMTGQFQRLQRQTSPLADISAADARGVHWITPNLVGEVSYAERTGSGRLRHPVWRGWRPDKKPADVVPE